jgi:protein TonB
MLKNLRQPDDIDAGQRIVVRVKFVVDKDGEISDIEVVQSGRSDLDKEVIRVVKKMPRWKPGMQNDRAVPVFFNMPVSFVNDEQ